MSETVHTTLGVTGMTCAACSSRVEKVLNKMDGVEAQVNLTTEKATVELTRRKHLLKILRTKLKISVTAF